MESVSVLPRVFEEIIGRKIDIENFDDRIIMQKLVYLLGEVRVSVGNYSFVWHKFGPYSQSLRNDISLIDKNDVFDGTFFEIVNKSISFIRDIFLQRDTRYTEREWLEAIASCVYMKKYLFPSENWEGIQERIVEIKKYLNYPEINLRCCNIAESILSF